MVVFSAFSVILFCMACVDKLWHQWDLFLLHVAVTILQFSSESGLSSILTKRCSNMHRLTAMQPGKLSELSLTGKQMHILK